MSNQTRRQFLRSAGIVTASMGAASVLQGWADLTPDYVPHMGGTCCRHNCTIDIVRVFGAAQGGGFRSC
jgi:hypothetical protein